MKGTVLVRMPDKMKEFANRIATEKGISVPEYIRTLISREQERLSRPKINPFITQQQTSKTETSEPITQEE